MCNELSKLVADYNSIPVNLRFIITSYRNTSSSWRSLLQIETIIDHSKVQLGVGFIEDEIIDVYIFQR